MHQVAKVLELQFSVSPSSEYSGLISFRIDWFDLLAVQGTLKHLLQRHNQKHVNTFYSHETHSLIGRDRKVKVTMM